MYGEDLYPTWAFTDMAAYPIPSHWTKAEDKLFEAALVTVPEGAPERWRLIGNLVGKSPEETVEHYVALVNDVADIDAGLVEIPFVWDEETEGEEETEERSRGAEGGGGGKVAERKKGTPWSEKEHMLFLIGLKQYGKGDWRSISRNVVVTRTPSQVASHAQKFFLRQLSRKKDKKRQSIHDITSVGPSSIYVPTDHSCAAPLVQQPQLIQQAPLPDQLLNQDVPMDCSDLVYPM